MTWLTFTDPKWSASQITIGYVLFVIFPITFFPHVWLVTGFPTIVTRNMYRFTLPENPSSHPYYCGSCFSIFSFVCSTFILSPIVCFILFLFLLAIALYVLPLPFWYFQAVIQFCVFLCFYEKGVFICK